MLRIITGRSGSGKTEKMLRMMKKTENAIYIVPEQYSFAAEKKVTRAFGISGMGFPSVYSFRRLAYFMEELYGGETGRELKGAGRVMALSDIVRKLSGELTLFGGAAKRGDMAAEAAVIITTFKQYGVTKDKIKKAIAETKNPLLKKKLCDCLIISESYDKFLEEGYRDADDLLEGLKKNIAITDYMDKKNIFIDSFQAFTPLEYSVIGELLKKADSVTVALCYADGGDEFVTAKRSIEHLKRLCADTGAGLETICEEPGAMFACSDELKAVEKSFFDFNDVYEAATDKIHIHRASDEYSEAMKAAREVERLCRDEGYRYRDIVIVARNMENYEKHLTRAFELFDIPLFMDKKTPLSGEAAAVFILSAIKTISSGWKNQNVFSYMKSIFSPVDAILASEIENYCMAAGVRKYDWKREENWDMPLSVKDREEDKEYLKRINYGRSLIVKPLAKLENDIKGKHTGKEMSVAIYRFMEECALEEKINKTADSLTCRGESIYALRMRQVYDMIIGVLECFCDAFGDKKISASEFLDIISKGIESIEIGVIPSTADCVCAGSIDRAKGHGAKAVIIVGAAEGIFPAVPTDSGVFTNSDRRELAEYGIELPPDTLGKTYMEESLVYSALTCAEERIFVSYPMGKDGNSPSVIIKRLNRVFPNAKLTDEMKNDCAMEHIGSAKSTYEEFVAAYSKILNGEDVEDEWFTALEYYKNSPVWKDRVREIERYASYDNRADIIRKELIDTRYTGGIETSVSRLEEYSKCPFAYFADVTLGLKERKELEVTAADSGTFLHEFVDIFGKSLADDNRTWRDIDKEYIDKKTEEITLELIKGLNKYMLETSPRARYLFIRLKQIAKRSVTALSEHMKKGIFEPLGYEIIFDKNGDIKPMVIELPNGKKATLRGRVDRADILETNRGKFVRIIDYKSGEKKFSLANIYYGFDLQLAVYLTAVCEAGDYHPAGMLYFKIDDPIVERKTAYDETALEREIMKNLKMDGLVLEDDEILKAIDEFYASGSSVIPVKRTAKGDFDAYSRVATEGEFRAISSHAKSTVRKLCNEILSGRAAISPVKSACTYCKMKTLCGFDTKLKGCSYRQSEKLNDKDALLKIIEEEKTI